MEAPQFSTAILGTWYRAYRGRSSLYADFGEVQGGPQSKLPSLILSEDTKNPPRLLHIMSIPGFSFCFPSSQTLCSSINTFFASPCHHELIL